MNETLSRRLAALSGLALAAAVALWWLGSTRLALDSGADTGRSSAAALQAAWLVRAIWLPLAGVRVGALRGWRVGAASGLLLVAGSWPLVLLAWFASPTPLWQLAAAEGLLLAAALALPAVGLGLRRVLPNVDLAELAATAVAIALATAAWLAQGLWALPAA